MTKPGQTAVVHRERSPARRALGIGIVLGACLATANVYMGLKTGWWESGGIIGALLAFLVLQRGGPRGDTDDDLALRTVLSQTAASSAAAMPAAMGLLGAIPALTLLGLYTPWWLLLLWGGALGALGLAMAVVFRAQLLEIERLPFPSGIAIAETIQELRRGLGRGAARVPLISALVAAAVTWLRDGVPAVIPATTWLPLQLAGFPPAAWTLGVTWSPMLFGMGILVGLRNGLGLLVAALVVWGGFAPMLVESGVVTTPDYDHLLVFLLWPGVALMVSAGLTSLVVQWHSIGLAFARARQVGPGSWRMRSVVVGTTLVIVVLGWQGFGIHPVVSGVMVGASMLGALVCARSVGETGLAPITQLGQLTQVGNGAVSAIAAPMSVASASIVAGAIVQSAQTMESFRVGQLLEVPPARQVRSASLGILLGTLVAVPAYLLVTHAYGIGTIDLPAPGATTWKAIGELLERGTDAVPAGATLAAGVAMVGGVVLQALARSSIGRVLPSPFVLGLAFLVPAYTCLAIALGSIAGAVLTRRLPGGANQVASLGAGAIAGESIVGVILAALVVGHVLPL